MIPKTDTKSNWRRKAREYLAAAFGGKCTICGYNKIISALDYHHIDPSHKDSILSTAMRNGYAWKRVVEEARKCTLVCCRCHREIHAGVTKLPKNYTKFNEEYADKIKLRKKEFNECPICGDEKYKRYSFCSTECSSLNQRRFTVNKEKLAKLVATTPFTKIGKMFGVTDNAIRKRCRKLGVPVPRKKKITLGT
ncbi:MAG: HNH endonuclease signature motif containing protein [Promethearchaeota archaeon]